MRETFNNLRNYVCAAICAVTLFVVGQSSAFAQADPLELTPFVTAEQFTEMQTAFVDWAAPVIIGVMLALLAVTGAYAVFRRLKGVVK